mgnify:CR=1 FL=1
MMLAHKHNATHSATVREEKWSRVGVDHVQGTTWISRGVVDDRAIPEGGFRGISHHDCTATQVRRTPVKVAHPKRRAARDRHEQVTSRVARTVVGKVTVLERQHTLATNDNSAAIGGGVVGKGARGDRAWRASDVLDHEATAAVVGRVVGKVTAVDRHLSCGRDHGAATAIARLARGKVRVANRNVALGQQGTAGRQPAGAGCKGALLDGGVDADRH